MFDFTLALVEIGEFIAAALGIVDPTTAVGGLLLVALGVRVVMGPLKRLKGIIPR